MNAMWGEMSEHCREEYKQFFLAYHNRVSQSGFTGRRQKPLSVLPPNLLRGFEEALLAKVPDSSYLLMPNMRQRMKMSLLGMLPNKLAQRLLHRRYSKSLPPLSRVTM